MLSGSMHFPYVGEELTPFPCHSTNTKRYKKERHFFLFTLSHPPPSPLPPFFFLFCTFLSRQFAPPLFSLFSDLTLIQEQQDMAAAAEAVVNTKGDNIKKSVPSKTSFSTWFIRLLPAIIFASYVYSTRGPFQSRACLAFGYNCRTFNPLDIQGTIDADRSEIYGPVTDYYSSLFTSHEDLGGSLAVFVEGKPVIDIFAGSKDLEGRVPYDNRTLQQVYSSGKAVEGIVIARLVQKGLLDYEAKVSQYWPEFAQNGKENVRLVDLMVHESGVFHLDDDNWDLTWASLQDKESFSARLAKQRHYFGGDVKRAYQAVSRGWYLNEIVRRVDPQARTIGRIAKDELMVDYPDLELHYGLFDDDDDWETRLSPMVEYPVLKIIGRLFLPRFLQTNEYIGYPDMEPLHPLVARLIRKWSISSKALTPRMAPFAKDYRTKQAHTTESTSFSLKTNAHSVSFFSLLFFLFLCSRPRHI